MITIRQHGDNGELFDMVIFKSDIEKFFTIEEWEIQVDWCLGELAQEIEKISAKPTRIKNLEFWQLYAGIHQTVDGCFSGLIKEIEYCKLQAVDSSFWNVSGSIEFEKHMENMYGPYAKPST
ncbi:hypothetical protein D9M71_351420 [compost metagenome]